ncbi:hypothetical protein Ancab_011292 [Ancistrocladus abbreviatus]
MPRNSRNLERKVVGGHCKIRKRGCSSPSSSSSLVKNHRLKRAILVDKKAGSSTPVPIWKMASRSPASGMLNFHGGEGLKSKGKESLTSARKLAATLWEINGGHSPKGNFEEKKERERKTVEKIGKLLEEGLFEPHLLDQCHSPNCEKIDGSIAGGHRRRSSVTSQKLQLTECIAAGLDSVGNIASSIEVTSQAAAENMVGVKTRLKDVSNSLTASKELVKVLFRMLSQEEQHSSKLTLVSALRVELDRARLQIDQLIQEHRCSYNEINAALKQFAAEKAAWKSKEQDRIRDAISSIARELEIEKKMRKQTERLNKKLGRELADTREDLSKAVKELDGERRAREILEQTCDELARGIGEDRAEVEVLKRESAKVREEVEKERQMLQLADVLREERVQMKLAEARYEFEEKNAALERLRSELEGYFGTDVSKENRDGTPPYDKNKEFADFLRKIQHGSCENGEQEHSEGEGVEGGGEDSGDSELHSIELNMDDINKNYKWSFAGDGVSQGDSRRTPGDEVFKGRKSLSEKIQWENICLQRKTSDGIEWDFTQNKQGRANGPEKGRSSALSAVGETNDYNDEISRHKSVKSLKDHMTLSNSGVGSHQSSISPIKESQFAGGVQ